MTEMASICLPLAQGSATRQMVRTQFWIDGKPVVFDHPIDLTGEEFDRVIAVLEIAKPAIVV